MNWKNWPYWLKGGVIGVSVALLSSILSLSCLYFFTSESSWGLGCLPLALPSVPTIYILLYFPGANSLSNTIIFFTNTTFWFIIGAFAGTFLGYIKSK
ncbi:MAG: hypothetical protein AAB511_01580 [Patescibacteria group bacterium]